MRASLWLSIWQSERGFKGEETAQAGSESAILHWKLTPASDRLPLLVIPSGYFCQVTAQETLCGLDPVSWLCSLKIIITTQVLVAQGIPNRSFVITCFRFSPPWYQWVWLPTTTTKPLLNIFAQRRHCFLTSVFIFLCCIWSSEI